jgi:hypothetical protein
MNWFATDFMDNGGDIFLRSPQYLGLQPGKMSVGFLRSFLPGPEVTELLKKGEKLPLSTQN